jgi:hypothetical protein
VPSVSLGARNCNAPRTSPAVIDVSPVSKVNSAPSSVLMLTSVVKSSEPVSILCTFAVESLPVPSQNIIPVLLFSIATARPLPTVPPVP